MLEFNPTTAIHGFAPGCSHQVTFVYRKPVHCPDLDMFALDLLLLLYVAHAICFISLQASFSVQHAMRPR